VNGERYYEKDKEFFGFQIKSVGWYKIVGVILMQKKGIYNSDYHLKRKGSGSFAYRLKRRNDEVLKSILELKGKSIDSLLDVGTADGMMLEKIDSKLKISHSFGFDISKSLLKVNKRKTILLCADALNQPFLNGSFDVLIASAFIEHVPDIKKTIKEFNRVLCSGGICIITTPNPIFEKIGLRVGYLKKKDIALSCKELFVRKGIRDLTISEVAKIAGIGKGTIYEYFKNKEEIVFEIVSILMQEHSEKLLSEIEQIECTKDKIKKFSELFYNTDDYELREIYKEFISITLINPNDEMIEFQTQSNERYYEWFKEIIQEGIDKNELIDQFTMSAPSISRNTIEFFK